MEKRNYNNRSATLIKPVSSNYTNSSSLCINILDMPGICFNNDGGWNELWIFDNGNISLEHSLDYGRVPIAIDSDVYYIEVDAEEEDNLWLNIRVTIKRKDN